MTRRYSAEEVRGKLLVQCLDAGGRKAWAEANGISPQYVTDVLKNRREPGESIVSALGMRRVVAYEYLR